MGNQSGGEGVASRRVEVFRDACGQVMSSHVKFKSVECASG